MPRGALRFRSRVKKAFFPAVRAGADENMSLMQSVCAILPEFNPVRIDSVARPMGRARNWLVLKSRCHLGEARFKDIPRRERAGLVRCPGAELGIPTARREIGVGRLVVDAQHFSLDANLSPQGFPMEQQSCKAALGNLARLVAFLVCIENEAIGTVALQQHHSYRGLSICIGSGQRHCIGVVEFFFSRLCKPEIEQ